MYGYEEETFGARCRPWPGMKWEAAGDTAHGHIAHRAAYVTGAVTDVRGGALRVILMEQLLLLLHQLPSRATTLLPLLLSWR